MYRRFLMENPNETIDNMTFYRAIQKYHKDTGVDALLVQCADHNVDAREKVLSNLMSLEHKQTQLAIVGNNDRLKIYHSARHRKIKGLLEQHRTSKRVNREFDADFLALAVKLRTVHFKGGHVDTENNFRASDPLLISIKHTDDMSDTNIPNNMLSVIYLVFFDPKRIHH